jgi:hypothetical protein
MRRAVDSKAALQVEQRRLDPCVVTGVGNELRRKHHAVVEALGILAVAVDKKSGVRDAEAVAVNRLPNLTPRIASPENVTQVGLLAEAVRP